MIFVTGDTHGQIDFEKLKVFSNENTSLTKNDYMIICGDFGGVWNPLTIDKELEPYINLPFTVLFIDGNHENFDLLSEYQISNWHGGKVHFISDNIIHLMRGQVFDIEGLLFFTMGGATSTDKKMRIENISWWKEEEISEDDIIEANKNLEKVNYKVDYVITHACSEDCYFYPLFRLGYYKSYRENRVLTNFNALIDYKHWYFGHYHLDGRVDDKRTALYDEIIRIK